MNDHLGDAAERLRAAGIESPRTEARLLWEHAQADWTTFQCFLERRLRREPMAYITGRKEFWSLEFEVGPGVLIPRPETETLIEVALAELPERAKAYRVLDLGTGSGCLLAALLTEYPNAIGVGIDSSEDALKWARRNVLRYGLENRVQLVRGEWDAVLAKIDLIISNPPYIRAGDLPGLSPDIRNYEPWMALDGGPDGLSAYRILASVLDANLTPESVAVLEIGIGQSYMVQEIMEGAGLEATKIASDLAGIPRCTVLRAFTAG